MSAGPPVLSSTPVIATICPMELLDSSDKSLRAAGRAIAQGKLVVIPTETVYGLGADAFNPDAVARVFEAKRRPSFDPLIVHIASLDQIERLASEFTPKARLLAEKLWPGPLTMVLPKRPQVPGIVTSGLDTVALRFPSHILARKIIEYSGTVVAAPSANPFGYVSPTTAGHVVRSLGDRVDFIVDGGPCDVGVESSVLDMTGPVPRLLRPGGMPMERIQKLIGDVLLSVSPEGKVASPGQLPSHYAPHAELYLMDRNQLCSVLDSILNPSEAALVVFDTQAMGELRGIESFGKVAVLSDKGDMRQAAARLFALLNELDAEGVRTIYAERVPDQGLGRAINDRLARASFKARQR
ncbi:MAG: L-threonylcarbamoyladenylate synthase [Candidatus Cloacimonadaceae bacterium]